MSIIPFSFISAAGLAFEHNLGLFNNIDLPWVLVAFATMLFRSLISFLTHYLSHRIPLFWRIHRIHHLDTALDVSTNVRFHPFEFILNAILGVPVIILFGFPVWVLMIYELFDIVVTLISHSNISFSPRVEKILKYVIITPDLHRIHHSAYQPETDSNFSAVFPIWDLIFGTYKSKTKVPPTEMTLGLEEVRDERTNNIIWLLLSPFKNLRKNQ